MSSAPLLDVARRPAPLAPTRIRGERQPLVRAPAPAAVPNGAAWRAKQLADRILAALALVLCTPLLLLIAAAVALSSPGPVLYRQRRLGRDGREFTMWKFRTMIGAEALLLPVASELAPGGVEAEDRRTRVGVWLRRSALDELPQLANVLCGDMSLIGPRPERPQYARLFAVTVPGYEARHRVRPGMTGLAQISGLRGRCLLRDRVALDNAYVDGWSLWLDCRIAIATVAALLRLEGE